MAYNFGQAASGAMTGAGLGSSFGPIGMGIGAGVGGLAGLFGGGAGGKRGGGPQEISTFDPQQQQLYDQYAQGLQGQGPFANLFNFDAQQAGNVFEQNVAAPAQRSYQENIVPQITGQFRGAGLGQSTFAGEALAKSGRDVQESLNAQRAQMMFQGQQGAQQRQLGGLQNILGQQTFGMAAPQQERGLLDQILGSLGPHAARGLADYLGSRGRGSKGKGSTPVDYTGEFDFGFGG